MGKTHLVIPDSHAHPDYHNERYSWLSKLIADVKPDVVVDIGDFWDMPSLCSYDKGTRSFEGRRYRKDIDAGLEANDRLITPLRKRKKKLPRLVRCLGNHEERIVRAIDKDPVLEGTIGLEDLQSDYFGWEEHNFKEVVNIDGINYSHYFVSGVMGRPITSARALLNRQRASCTMGHTHTFEYETGSNVEGRRSHALFCGVFQDYDPSFADATSYLWRRGVAIKHSVDNGNYDIEWVSLDRLREIYG